MKEEKSNSPLKPKRVTRIPKTKTSSNISNFNKMSIYELKQHEQGILNLYNKDFPSKGIHNKLTSKENAFDVRLTNFEYDSIFDNPPTF